MTSTGMKMSIIIIRKNMTDAFIIEHYHFQILFIPIILSFRKCWDGVSQSWANLISQSLNHSPGDPMDLSASGLIISLIVGSGQ